MTEKDQPYQNIVQIESPSNLKIKAAFGTALILGVVVLAWFFRFWVGAFLAIVAAIWLWRVWEAIQTERKIKNSEQELLGIEVEQANEELEIVQVNHDIAKEKREQEHTETLRGRLELQELAIRIKFHYYPKIGLFQFFNDGTFELMRERRTITDAQELKMAQLAQPQNDPAFNPSLLQVMTQREITYAVTGAQRSGKSWQVAHFADYWLSLGIPPKVIGPKTDNPGFDWTGCDRIITDNKEDLAAALREVMADAARRQGLLKENRTPAPVILDDWIGTLLINKRAAYEFMGVAASTMVSSGIVTYFLMQGDTAAAYGLQDLGAMLKEHFMRLNIYAHYDGNGLVVPGKSKGELLYPHSAEAVPVDLIQGRPNCFPNPTANGHPQGLIIEGDTKAESELTPDEKDQVAREKIRAALVEKPDLGIGALQIEGWGAKGGSQYEQRKEIIQEIKSDLGVS